MNPLLVAERAKIDFDREEAVKLLYSPEQRHEFEWAERLVKKHPEVAGTIEYYEMTREEKFTEWWNRLKVIMSDPEFRSMILTNSHKKSKYFNWFYLFTGSNPMTLHMQMFTKSIKELGSEE
mmetsp:Transcript_27127/g.33703  ORF Transcript_27127/g.33703 Transcript_27127/m.33703 type:complete len:122 (+) Transcript_27127:126-491(+)